MVFTMIIGIIAVVCLVSTFLLYGFMRSRTNRNSSDHEKQQIIHSLRPSIDIITKRLHPDHRPSRFSTSSSRSNHSNDSTNYHVVNEFSHKKQHRSAGSVYSPMPQARSTSMATSLFPLRRPRSANWRQGSIVDPNQLALIQFSVPSTNNKYRRRSVAVCNSLSEPKEHPLTTSASTSPCLLSFSITYLANSQLKVQFHSLQSLPSTIHLQQLTIKVKLTPGGKEKSIQIRKSIENETILGEEYDLLFSHIPFERIHERNLSMIIYGKDQAKKTIHLGHIGKIRFGEIKNFEQENPIDFIHEIENTKLSSVELLIALQKKDDQSIHVNLQRIKGLKIDQKKLGSDDKFYLQVTLLDYHYRILSTKQSQFYRLNSSHVKLDEQYDLNMLSYHSNNLDRLILMFNLYTTNSNHTNEYKCVARVKLASALFCSGSGTIHWQQFQARESFSMWHTLNKEHH